MTVSGTNYRNIEIAMLIAAMAFPSLRIGRKDEKTLTNKTETDINDRYSNMTEMPLGSKRD